MRHRIFLLLSFLLVAYGLSAQTLVFHLPDGAISKVTMPCTFTFSASGDNLIIDGSGTHVELQRDRILSMTYRANRGDSNGDMTVDVADIATIISIMSGAEDGNDNPGTTPDNPKPNVDMGDAPEGTEAVDLGLPSGTLWGSMNVGANSPKGMGMYFSWGETTGYTNDTNDGRKFDWGSYKWMTSGKSGSQWVNKYQADDGQTDGCWYEGENFIGDGLLELLPEDDAATANWKGDWRMPTHEDFLELIEYTDCEWLSSGVRGYKFTSMKDKTKSIFLPAAGYRDYNSYRDQGAKGFYWSSTVDKKISQYAHEFFFHSGGVEAYYTTYRYDGQSVRPVIKKKK